MVKSNYMYSYWLPIPVPYSCLSVQCLSGVTHTPVTRVCVTPFHLLHQDQSIFAALFDGARSLFQPFEVSGVMPVNARATLFGAI
ncbi:hypothetical protein Plhal304r1_c056g0141621 [Plasmopara halstedii]